MVDKNELTLEELTIEEFVGIGLDYIQAHGDRFYVKNDEYLKEALAYIYENHPDRDDAVAETVERYTIYSKDMLVEAIDANIYPHAPYSEDDFVKYVNSSGGEVHGSLKGIELTEESLPKFNSQIIRDIADLLYDPPRNPVPVILLHDDLFVIRDAGK